MNCFVRGLSSAFLFLLFIAGATAQGERSSLPAPPIASRLLIDAREPKPLWRAEEQALRPLDLFKECPVCPAMIVVPSGEFMMGAPDGEENSEDNEKPRHEVRIAKQFSVGRFAVTFDEWDACVSDGGCRNYLPSDKGWGRGRRPVINLRWDDAKAYVRWLSDKTGKPYRLLSEAEREYVTRAGTTTPFWWGANLSTERANYDGDYWYPSAGGLKGKYRGKTLPVDAFDPNPWGLYQVHGNVYEWVEDCWHPDYNGAPTDGSAWTKPDCERHVLRGGSWNFAGWHLRAASRGATASAAWLLPLGMRVARAINWSLGHEPRLYSGGQNGN
jgi:formylglycine-generating enzyme required for sulfatase activity